MVNNKGKRCKASNKVKPVENINKNPRRFLLISLMQKEVPFPSHKLEDHAYE